MTAMLKLKVVTKNICLQGYLQMHDLHLSFMKIAHAPMHIHIHSHMHRDLASPFSAIYFWKSVLRENYYSRMVLSQVDVVRNSFLLKIIHNVSL
jgi:hypothetical protein